MWPLGARQAARYRHEKKKLKQTFGDCVSFLEEPGFVRIELRASTNKLGNSYTLRCYLPNNYPSSCPFLVVSKPDTPLKDFYGNILGVSYDNHCLGSDNEFGLTAICHCRPDRWEANEMNITEVLMKGLKWLEAYEIMITTGEVMDTFLSEMPMSREKLQKIKRLRKNLERELADVQESNLNPQEKFIREIGLCFAMDVMMEQVSHQEELLDQEELQET